VRLSGAFEFVHTGHLNKPGLHAISSVSGQIVVVHLAARAGVGLLSTIRRFMKP